jgi:hypothetical protein
MDPNIDPSAKARELLQHMAAADEQKSREQRSKMLRSLLWSTCRVVLISSVRKSIEAPYLSVVNAYIALDI